MELTFFTQQYSLEIHPWVYELFATLYGCIVFHDTDLHLLNDIWVVSSLGLLQIKVLWRSCTGFCMNVSFHFSGVSAQECICLVVWQVHVNHLFFKRCVDLFTAKPFFVWKCLQFCLILNDSLVGYKTSVDNIFAEQLRSIGCLLPFFLWLWGFLFTAGIL